MAALSVLVDPNECLSLLIPNEFRDPNEFLSSRLGIRARICCLSGWFVSLGGACAPRRVCGGPGSAAVARRFRLRSCIQNRIYINRSSLAQLRGSCSAAGELQAWAFRVGGAAGRGAARGGTQPIHSPQWASDDSHAALARHEASPRTAPSLPTAHDGAVPLCAGRRRSGRSAGHHVHSGYVAVVPKELRTAQKPTE